jgi:hypothetical protein
MVETQALVKVAEGREAEMFEWGDGRLLRLLRNPLHAGSMQWEAAATRAARSGGLRVPEVYEMRSVNGRPGMVVERIQGRDLLSEIAAGPWRLWSIGKACGELHARMAGITAGPDLRELRETLADQIRRSPLVPETYADYALRELEELPEGNSLCHGDFHPANVLRSGGGLVVIDWTNAARGASLADFARSMLMLKLGDPPPGAPWLIRAGARFARVLLKAAYERTYRRSLPVEPALYQRWETVRAVHRLQDGIESERKKLIHLIDRRLGATPGA